VREDEMASEIKLRVLSGTLKGKEYVFTDQAFPSILLGRSKGSQLQFDPHGDTSVGREHAVIQWQGGHPLIKDNGSHNGTVVNQQDVGPNLRPLVEGDVIGIGADGPRIKVESITVPGGASAPATPSAPAAAPPAAQRPPTMVHIREQTARRAGQTLAVVLSFLALAAALACGGYLFHVSRAESTVSVFAANEEAVCLFYYLEKTSADEWTPRPLGSGCFLGNNLAATSASVVLRHLYVARRDRAASGGRISKLKVLASGRGATPSKVFDVAAEGDVQLHPKYDLGERPIEELTPPQFEQFLADRRTSYDVATAKFFLENPADIPQTVQLAADLSGLSCGVPLVVVGYHWRQGEVETEKDLLLLRPYVFCGNIARLESFSGSGFPGVISTDIMTTPRSDMNGWAIGGPVLGRDGRVVGLLNDGSWLLRGISIDVLSTWLGQQKG
jgi:hypothetical protein